MRLLILASFAIVLQACAQEGDNSAETSESKTDTTSTAFGPVINTEGMLLQTRFNPPKGFEREAVDSGSFAHYLRNLPLKEAGTLVKYYDGSSKSSYVYDAVVDLDIGKRNLHQCADAVMRLKAEYLWDSKQYDKIHFNFTNGFRVDYSEWMKGKRMVVKGNKTYWVNGAARANNYQDFWKYMELIFNYAGTLSLDREMKSKPVDQMEIGDVFILGGSPGHAVIVADMVVNPNTGEKKFLLAQSYMPAQETQILKNPINPTSPWYSADFDEVLTTPEWTFYANQLKGWE
ncbi:MAG: hypothetical protein ACJASQ_001062 [Crocinitomicaceae bacterium]|jgi:hypothetical protein